MKVNGGRVICTIALVSRWILVTPEVHADSITYSVVNLGTLGGSASTAVGINSLGQTVGYSLTTGDAATHAFLYSSGTITDLGTLGGTNSQANGINNSGQIVGIADTGAGTQHAFLDSNGSMYDIGTLGGQFSQALGINDSGQITGLAAIRGSGVPYHAFKYSNGSMQDLGTLGGTNSVGTSINNAGQVTGGSDITNSTTDHAFLYNGSMTDLDNTDGFFNSGGNAINNAGDIAGSRETGNHNGSGGATATLYRNGTVTSLGTIGGAYNITMGINDNDDIVGYSGPCFDGVDPSTPFICPGQQGFLYSNGTLYNLNDLITTSGWTISDAIGINDNGQIAATGIFDGQQFAVLLDPTSDSSSSPEPASSLLLLGGIALVIAKRSALYRRSRPPQA